MICKGASSLGLRSELLLQNHIAHRNMSGRPCPLPTAYFDLLQNRYSYPRISFISITLFQYQYRRMVYRQSALLIVKQTPLVNCRLLVDITCLPIPLSVRKVIKQELVWDDIGEGLVG
jgi:hypothetical protein